MSTVIVRRVASTPTRTASETWAKIVEMLAPDPSDANRQELGAAGGVACAAISTEAVKESPIVLYGSGSRVRIYCIFGDDAITGDGVEEDDLLNSPLTGNWRMSIPCQPEDVLWSKKKLASVSHRILARSPEDDVGEIESSPRSAKPLTIDTKEFLKP